MSRFGNYLQEHGLLSAEQLEEALQHQDGNGARLGTNLIELGMIGVEQLAECLSRFHGVPLPPRKWLERPQRAAVKRVTRPLVERLRFVPMRLDGNVLHVAMLDPRDPHVLDDLRFASGCRIEPYVLPEVWMHDWLLALFKMPRGIRQVQVAHSPTDPPAEVDAMYDFQTVNFVQAAAMGQQPESAKVARAIPPVPAAARVRSRVATEPMVNLPQPASAVQVSATAAQASAASAAQVERTWGSITPVQASEAAVTVRSLAELAAGIDRPSAQPVAEPAPVKAPDPEAAAFWQRRPVFNWSAPDEPPRARPSSRPVPSAQPSGIVRPVRAAAGELGKLEAALREVQDRERLLELSFVIGASFASTLALFVVQRGEVQGLRCVHRGAPRAIDGVLPLEPPCMLIDAANAGEPIRVDPRARTSDQRIVQLVGDVETGEAGLFPVAVKQRVVNVLYASNGGEPLGAIAFAALGALAQQIGAAYEQLILIRKAAGSAR
jgi:hypothetical protein